MKKYMMIIVVILMSHLCKGQEPINLLQFVVSPKVLNLRDAPSINSRVVGKLIKGQRLSLDYKTGQVDQVGGRIGEWLKIQCDSLEGFVFDYYVTPIVSVYDTEFYTPEVKGVNFYYSNVKNASNSLQTYFPNIQSDEGDKNHFISLPDEVDKPLVFSSYLNLERDKTVIDHLNSGVLDYNKTYPLCTLTDSIGMLRVELKTLWANDFRSVFVNQYRMSDNHEKGQMVSSNRLHFLQSISSHESIELVWYGDLNADKLPEIILNIKTSKSTKQLFFIADAKGDYIEWSAKEMLFDTCLEAF